jgi:hypothetical protein
MVISTMAQPPSWSPARPAGNMRPEQQPLRIRLAERDLDGPEPLGLVLAQPAALEPGHHRAPGPAETRRP